MQHRRHIRAAARAGRPRGALHLSRLDAVPSAARGLRSLLQHPARFDLCPGADATTVAGAHCKCSAFHRLPLPLVLAARVPTVHHRLSFIRDTRAHMLLLLLHLTPPRLQFTGFQISRARGASLLHLRAPSTWW